MKWTHTPLISTSETGGVVVKEDDGWLALPDGGEGGAIGTFEAREDAMAAIERDYGARLCCADRECAPQSAGEFTISDAEVIGKARAFQGYFAVDRYHLRHRLFGGGWSEPIRREVFERGHAVAVLLFDPARDELVFVEQFRPGAYAALHAGESMANGAPWLIECVAGIVEKGESPEDVARREAFEEAHCRIDELIPVSRFFVSPGGSSETVALYCGITQAPENGSLHGLAEEHEDIRVLCLDSSSAIGRLKQGRLNNAITLIAMQWFALNRETLRKTWS